MWDACPIRDAMALERIQLSIARAVLKLSRHDHSNISVLEAIGWPSLAWRRRRFKLLLLWDLLHGGGPPLLHEQVPPTVSSRSPYPLRNSLSISLPTCHSSRYSKSFLVSAISLYNSLPQSVSSCSSKHSFAQALNHHFASDKFSFGISWVFEYFFCLFFFVFRTFSFSTSFSLSLSLSLSLSFSIYFLLIFSSPLFKESLNISQFVLFGNPCKTYNNNNNNYYYYYYSSRLLQRYEYCTYTQQSLDFCIHIFLWWLWFKFAHSEAIHTTGRFSTATGTSTIIVANRDCSDSHANASRLCSSVCWHRNEPLVRCRKKRSRPNAF